MATYSASEHFGWIARAAPAFRVDGDKVEVLRDPSQFYERLKVYCVFNSVLFLISCLLCRIFQLESLVPTVC